MNPILLLPPSPLHRTSAPARTVIPPVPVLTATLLGLELLAHRPAFDLASAAHLVGSDPGALLHLFALVAEDLPDPSGRPIRLGECLSILPPRRLLQTLVDAHHHHADQRFHRAAHAGFAAHALAIARSSETVASSLGLASEQAHLVGLLHELGHLPGLLGWQPAEPIAACDQLARAYGLPPALRSALDDIHRQGSPSIWSAVIAAAHDLLPRPVAPTSEPA